MSRGVLVAKDAKPHPMQSSPGPQGRPSWGRGGVGSSASPSCASEVSASAAVRARGCQASEGLEIQSGFWSGSLEPEAALKEFKRRESIQADLRTRSMTLAAG